MALVALVKETLNEGDPTIREFPMVHSYYTPFVATLMYVVFVKWLGPFLMQSKKPFNLRTLMITYNFFVVTVYSSCLLLLIYFFLTTDAYKRICSPTVVRFDDYTYPAVVAGWIIYVLKYVEFADTIFFVLRKKDHLITNLHVIHHASLPILGWILLRSERSGFQFLPGGLNSFVHIIMYTYYGLAAMGPQVQKYLWWKEYLTRLQMLQFVLILAFVFVIIPLSGCKTSKHGIYMDIFFALLFLGLFYNFYTKTYKRSPMAKGMQQVSNGKANGHSPISNGHSFTKSMVEANGHAKDRITEDSHTNGGLRQR